MPGDLLPIFSAFYRFSLSHSLTPSVNGILGNFVSVWPWLLDIQGKQNAVIPEGNLIEVNKGEHVCWSVCVFLIAVLNFIVIKDLNT